MSPSPRPEPATGPAIGPETRRQVGDAPSLARRLAAAFYDALLLLAVLFFATLAVLPLTGGRAIEPANMLYNTYLIAVSYGYFGWFWTHGGRTLGMRAWRLQLTTTNGEAMTWGRSLARFAGAMLSWLAVGGGFLWALFDPQRLTWHDRLSRSTLALDSQAKK